MILVFRLSVFSFHRGSNSFFLMKYCGKEKWSFDSVDNRVENIKRKMSTVKLIHAILAHIILFTEWDNQVMIRVTWSLITDCLINLVKTSYSEEGEREEAEV